MYKFPTISKEEAAEYEEYDSNNDSSDSSTDEETVLLHDYWIKTQENLYGDKLYREYTPTMQRTFNYRLDNTLFAYDVEILIGFIKGIKGMMFHIDCLEAESSTIITRKVRFDAATVLDSSFINNLKIWITQGIVPTYVDLNNMVNSDAVHKSALEWKLDWCAIVTEIPMDEAMTVVIGSETLIPGYRTCVIDQSSHNISYNPTDCLFIILNEVTGKRYKPDDIKKQLFGDEKYNISKVSIRNRKRISAVAKIYNISLFVNDVRKDSKYIFNKDGMYPVKLVKHGSLIGLLYDDKGLDIPTPPKSPDNVYDIFYDLETIEIDDQTRVYCFSILCGNYLFTCCRRDVNFVEAILIDRLSSICNNKGKYYLHAWNGSRFDHQILMRVIQRTNYRLKHSVFNDAKELISAVISIQDSTVILRDPCKMFPCTLEEACATFGVDMSKDKLPVTHDEIQQNWNYIEKYESLISSYCEKDVIMLSKVVDKLVLLYEGEDMVYRNYFTRSMASYNRWYKSGVDKKIIDDLSYGPYKEIINDVRWEEIKSDCIAGRVEAYKGEYNNCNMIDVHSMYPSVCVSEYYPAGSYNIVSKRNKDKLGVYLVEINKHGHHVVIPERKKDIYNWINPGVGFKKWVTSVDLDMMDKVGYKYHMHKGIEWEHKTKDFFKDYMEVLIDKRSKADSIPKKQLYKDMATALTGNLIQKSFRTVHKIINKTDNTDQEIKLLSPYTELIGVYDIGDKKILELKPKKLTKSNEIEMQIKLLKECVSSRPTILTTYIYSYARYKLLDKWMEIESLGGKVIYCDTDSLIFNGVDINKITEIGDGLGKWGVEYSNCDAVIYRPKVYALKKGSQEKVRIAGVNKKAYTFTVDKEVYKLYKTACEGYTNEDLWNKITKHVKHYPCYDDIYQLLRGKVIVVFDWSFYKLYVGIKKRYNIKLIEG